MRRLFNLARNAAKNEAIFLPTEDQQQIAIMNWAKWHPLLSKFLIHIPNGGSRHKGEARKLKAMGVKAGVSDLFLAYPSHGYHGLWLEGKSLKGKLSKHQIDWLDRMKSVGYKTDVFFCFEQAKRMIENYLDGIEK
jgi:hypothetical protein